MNREAKDWKCPDCDTINIGRRCVICGKEKPENKANLEIRNEEKVERKKTGLTKRSILIISGAVIIFLVIGFFVANSWIDSKKETIEVSETEKKPKKEEKEVFIKDTIYKNNFSVSVDKHEMDKRPEYERREVGRVWYSVPMNFKNREEDSYSAYDETAYLRFFSRKVGEDKTVSSLMEDAQIRFNGGVTYEKAEYNWYQFRAEIEDVKYFYCEKFQNGEAVGMVFAYPKEYADIYDDYMDELYKNLNFPIDVIEI